MPASQPMRERLPALLYFSYSLWSQLQLSPGRSRRGDEGQPCVKGGSCWVCCPLPPTPRFGFPSPITSLGQSPPVWAELEWFGWNGSGYRATGGWKDVQGCDVPGVLWMRHSPLPKGLDLGDRDPDQWQVFSLCSLSHIFSPAPAHPALLLLLAAAAGHSGVGVGQELAQPVCFPSGPVSAQNTVKQSGMGAPAELCRQVCVCVFVALCLDTREVLCSPGFSFRRGAGLSP